MPSLLQPAAPLLSVNNRLHHHHSMCLNLIQTIWVIRYKLLLFFIKFMLISITSHPSSSINGAGSRSESEVFTFTPLSLLITLLFVLNCTGTFILTVTKNEMRNEKWEMGRGNDSGTFSKKKDAGIRNMAGLRSTTCYCGYLKCLWRSSFKQFGVRSLQFGVSSQAYVTSQAHVAIQAFVASHAYSEF